MEKNILLEEYEIINNNNNNDIINNLSPQLSPY